jgi:hypothetical protein
MRENTRTRQAFDIYWRLGASRSIERLHAAMSANGRAPTLRTLYAWSSDLHWQHRLARLEEDAKRAEDEARVQALREMYERHINEALVLQQKGTQWLTAKGMEDTTADTAIRAIVEGARMERLARGEPTERREVNGEFQINARLAAVSDDELDNLIELAARPVVREVAPRPGRPLLLGDGEADDSGTAADPHASDRGHRS